MRSDYIAYASNGCGASYSAFFSEFRRALAACRRKRTEGYDYWHIIRGADGIALAQSRNVREAT